MSGEQGDIPRGGEISLYELPVGKSARVSSIQLDGMQRRRLMDLGLIPGTMVEVLRVSPSGDPRAFRIRGAVIAFRKEESRKIMVICKGE